MVPGRKGLTDGPWGMVSQVPTCSFANSRALTLRGAEQSREKENSGDQAVTGSTCS